MRLGSTFATELIGKLGTEEGAERKIRQNYLKTHQKQCQMEEIVNSLKMVGKSSQYRSEGGSGGGEGNLVMIIWKRETAPGTMPEGSTSNRKL